MRTLFLEAWLHPSLRLVGAGIQQELHYFHVAIASCPQQSGITSAKLRLLSVDLYSCNMKNFKGYCDTVVFRKRGLSIDLSAVTALAL